MRRAVLTALSFLFLAFTAGTAMACTTAEVAAPGDAVRSARAALMRIPLGEMDTAVRPDAQRAIEATKDRIIAFVTAAMTCTDTGAAPAAIQQFLAAQGDAFEDRTAYTENNPGRDMHGNGLSYEVAAVPQHPELLAVVARLAIECGDDAVLLLFDRTARGWRPVLIRRAPPYRGVNGAFGSYRYAVSPSDAQGHWFVATVRRPPWCTSNWSSLYYELSRPGPTPAAPDVFFRGRAGVYFGLADDVVLRADAAGFQLVHDGGFFDPGVLIRRHVETYAVAGNRVTRIAPVAFNVRDFVDEWIDADWADASAWSAGTARLMEVHRRLRPTSDGRAYMEQGPIRRCAADLHEVQIDEFETRTGGVGRPRGSWYFLVRGQGPYRLESLTRSPAPRCTGPDVRAAIESAIQTERDRRAN